MATIIIDIDDRFPAEKALKKFKRMCDAFGIVKEYCGHGIGKKPHEEPEIPNYLSGTTTKSGPKIKNGMVFCLEPMICQKDSQPIILDNKWDVVSADGLRGSHYEHTVAIVNGKMK